jgi:alginate O-acetyltransferase complex protein AlgI
MFVLWGSLHGVYLCVERVFRRIIPFEVDHPLVKYIGTGLLVIFTYLVISITWIPFRATSFDQCLGMMRGMFVGAFKFEPGQLKYFGVVVLVLICHNVSEKCNFLGRIEQNSTLLGGLVIIILLSLFYYGGKRVDFIYFKF